MSEHDHLIDPTPVPPPSPWNIANALTVLRVLMVPVYGWLLLADGGSNPALRFWAAGVFVLATLTDRIDGEIARRRGLITNFGKVADPIADKALMGMAFVGLSLLGELPWWVTVLVLVREWGVTAAAVLRHPAWGHARRPRWEGEDRAAERDADAVLVAAVGSAALRALDGRRVGHAGAGGRRHGGDRGRLRDEGPAPAPDERAGSDEAREGVAAPMSLPAADLVSVLTGRGQTVACAESLTGGLVCAALTDVPGASAVVRGAVVSYATALKATLLGVDPDLLARTGAVDAEVARQMAQGVCRVLASDWGVATTGVAGPDPQDGAAVGTVFVAVAGPGGSRVTEGHFDGDRAAIRAAAVTAALALLRAELAAVEEAPALGG